MKADEAELWCEAMQKRIDQYATQQFGPHNSIPELIGPVFELVAELPNALRLIRGLIKVLSNTNLDFDKPEVKAVMSELLMLSFCEGVYATCHVATQMSPDINKNELRQKSVLSLADVVSGKISFAMTAEQAAEVVGVVTEESKQQLENMRIVAIDKERKLASAILAQFMLSSDDCQTLAAGIRKNEVQRN